MYRPNQNCVIRAADTNDVFGQPVPGPKKKERCAIITHLISGKKTTVRTDSSASRGSAREIDASLVILLSPKTVANIESIVEVLGKRFRITSKETRLAISGRIDHYECRGDYWSEIEA